MKKYEKESLELVCEALCEASAKARDAQEEIRMGKIGGAQVALAEIDGLTDAADGILNDILTMNENSSLKSISLNVEDLSENIENLWDFLECDEEETEEG